jgi:hypothetical protein
MNRFGQSYQPTANSVFKTTIGTLLQTELLKSVGGQSIDSRINLRSNRLKPLISLATILLDDIVKLKTFL